MADQPLMVILHYVYDTGEPFQESEVLVPLARYEGGPIENIYFDLTYLVGRNETGQTDGFVTYAYDVTAQVLARRECEAQLTRTNLDLDTFVYTASHDLKAPITNIEAMLAALRETLPPRCSSTKR